MKSNQVSKILKTLSKNLLKYPEEVKQEEDIKLWMNPDLEGYQGLLAYNELVYKEYEEYKRTRGIKTVPLKKNIPAKAGISISNDLILEFINSFDKTDRGRISLRLQPLLKHLYLGKDCGSYEKLAEELHISKSNLYRILSIPPKEE